MKIGFAIPVSGSWATPENQVQIAQHAERLGYEGLWTLQRLLYPASPTDAPLGDSYRNVADPIVTLAFLAGHTSRVRLGLAIVNMPFWSPALLAKQLATLDVVSGGRLDAGLGLGWLKAEFVASGIPYERRGARAEEYLDVLRTLWTEEITEFSGSFYEVPPARLEPKPVQRPHPPILLGGTADRALRRAGRLADGWISSSRADLARIGESIRLVKATAEEAGRNPDTLRFICRGVTRVRPGTSERKPLTGSYDDIRQDVADLEAQGVTEVFHDLNFDEEIASMTADPASSMHRAEEALEELAP